MIQSELDAIKNQAAFHGIPWQLVAAVRVAENGTGDALDGAPYGVLDPRVLALRSQSESLREACASLREKIVAAQHSVPVWTEGAGMPIDETRRYVTMMLTDAAIEEIRKTWAPPRAANDPNNKNANWVGNVTTWYRRFLARGEAAWLDPTGEASTRAGLIWGPKAEAPEVPVLRDILGELKQRIGQGETVIGDLNKISDLLHDLIAQGVAAASDRAKIIALLTSFQQPAPPDEGVTKVEVVSHGPVTTHGPK